jgi:hypothetical protein
VLAATYGNVLTIALLHSLDVVRYRVSYAPGFLLGLVMTTNYLLIFAFGTRIRHERGGESIALDTNSAPASGSQR